MPDRPRLPPLNALRVFEAAARLGSFKRAADELHVTPTAVSHQVKLLEEIVGTPLFERRTRAVVPTEAAQRLFPALREGFDRIAQAVAELQGDGESLVLSVTPAFGAKVVIPNLAALQARHPSLRLRVHATETPVDLRKAEADLAVRYSLPRPTPLRAVPLVTDRYVAVAAPSFLERLGRGAALDAGTIASSSLVAYPWRNPLLGGPTWPEWMALAGVAGFDATRCHVFSEEALAVQAAVEGIGIALLSDALVRADLAAGRLAQVHALALPGFTFKAVYLPDHPKAAAIRRVVRWLAEATRAPLHYA